VELRTALTVVRATQNIVGATQTFFVVSETLVWERDCKLNCVTAV